MVSIRTKNNLLRAISARLFQWNGTEMIPDKMWYWLLAGAIFVHLATLPVVIMEPDSAIYALVSKTMATSGNYLELFLYGEDWLDKPHFQFWISALSFQMLGVNTIAFKLPAILFTLLAAFYIYRFAREQYNRQIARLATLIFLTAFHIIISNLDVRAEPYLTGLIIASVYHFYKVRIRAKRRVLHLFAGAAFAACAVMTKGLFTLAPIGFAVIGDIAIKREWRELFRVEWLLAFVLTALFISPELYALYYQFDLHPEKTVFGEQGVSGVRFFLWDSQWGRFSNTGPIKGDGNFFTFFHTVLWSFLPWSIALYLAIIGKIRRNIPQVNTAEEFYTIAGAGTTFLLFSLSEFQLPHYLNIIFPFFAIIAADYIFRLETPAALRRFSMIQYFLTGMMVLITLFFYFFFQPERTPLLWWLALPTLVLLFFVIRPSLGHPVKRVVIWKTCLGSFFLYLFLILVFYPNLLTYQSGSIAARDVNSSIPGDQVTGLYNWKPRSFNFYVKNDLVLYQYMRSIKEDAERSELIIFTDEEGFEKLKRVKQLRVKAIREYEHYRVTRLTLAFLNPDTRDEQLERSFLVRVRKN